MEGGHDAPTQRISTEIAKLFSGALTVEDFVATIVHEAAQPLTAIQVLTSALRSSGDKIDANERDQLLADIEGQARFLQELSTWMLRPFARETLQLDTLVELATDRCRPLVPGHELRHDPAGDEVSVTCEVVRVESSIRNLVKNAAASARPGTPITVASGRNGKYASITVADQGTGIDVANWERIFKPYERLDLERPGRSGLGLFLVASAAANHGGYARVASSGPSGTTIEMALEADV